MGILFAVVGSLFPLASPYASTSPAQYRMINEMVVLLVLVWHTTCTGTGKEFRRETEKED